MKIQNFLSRYTNQIYALMRIVIGILFISHGIQKADAMVSGMMPADNFLLVLASIIETLCGFMVIIGWKTDWAAFIASGEMAVAYFKGHAPRGFLPVNNGGELAVIYCFIFLLIAANGAGTWSLDHILGKKMNQ